ncbi:MAG: hypothetical protein R3254_09425 [Thiomicrorhabdus sp.]|nr:hypothetical protein [Thiomicrorhabdus sp.]
MAVLIEGYSIIINKQKALQNQNALEVLGAVEGTLHPTAICSDQDLLRIGFVDLAQAKEFLAALEGAGLKQGKEMVVVSQFGETETPNDWLKIQFTKLKDNTLVCIASLQSVDVINGVAMPKGWQLDISLLKRYFEERTSYMHEYYDLLREEPMHDIYRHKETGNEVRLLKLVFKPLEETQIQ